MRLIIKTLLLALLLIPTALNAQELNRRLHWRETITPLTSNGTFIGAAHEDGSLNMNGGLSKWGTFSCFAWADQSGTLSIEVSDNGTNWVAVQSQPWVASSSIYLVQPIFSKYWRCKVLNGTAPQGAFVVYSAFGL